MLRIKDRAEREFCYAPTAEEVLCDIVRKEIRSYRQLPVNFYQIQTKFRDEIRPRFGVMRAREFTMKDAYSFDADFDGLEEELPGDVRRLHAHLHAPGPEVPRGRRRHRRDRRHRLARVPGARAIGRGCDRVLRRARTTRRTSSWPKRSRLPRRAPPPTQAMKKVATPGKHTCEEVAAASSAFRIEKTVKSHRGHARARGQRRRDRACSSCAATTC